MKRLLAVFLAFLFMLASSVSVSAERLVGAEDGGGVSIFPESPSTSHGIFVSVQENLSRYAVDVTFDTLGFTFTGLIWDVNDHKYIMSEQAENTSEAKNVNVTLTNHSNEAVLSSISFEDFPQSLTASANKTSSEISGVKYGSTVTTPTAVNFDFNITLTPTETWETVMNELIKDHGIEGTSFPLGTVSVTISKP